MSSTSGFAQIIVVGALATIAALLATAVPATTANSRVAAALERLAEIDIAAGSAFRRVIAALALPEDTLEVEALTSEVAVMRGTVRIETETGKLDVMLADLALFDRLAQTLAHPDRSVFLNALTAARAAGKARRALELVRTELARGLYSHCSGRLVDCRCGRSKPPTKMPEGALSLRLGRPVMHPSPGRTHRTGLV